MEFKNAIVDKIFDVETGVSQNGKEWKSQNVIFRENIAIPHPDRQVIKFFNEKVDLVKDLRVGDIVSVGWSSEVREYTYTSKKTGEQVTSAQVENYGFTINGKVA